MIAINRLYLACFFAIAFLIALPWSPYPGEVVAKTLPCLALFTACWQMLKGKTRTIMCAATLLSAMADAAIEFAFIAGLLLFLCVQLSYCLVFFRRMGDWKKRLWLVAVLVAFFIWALVFLVPKAAQMAIPVAVYMTAICAMGILAAGYSGSVLVVCGAVSFMASDTLIGVNRFWMPVPAADLAIMSSYYLGQILIVAGVIQTERVGSQQVFSE